MFHEPAAQSGKDPASPYKTRLGTWMFALYALVYAGFVAIAIGKPVLLEWIVVSGLNLATVYGLFLIVFALVLALIYNARCNSKERELAGVDPNEEGS
jgi:uncharacterized membrane protein (DUF485 family)